MTQNFHPAVKAIENKICEIATFLRNMLIIFENHLTHEISPAEKNETSQRFHCTLQVAIFCFKIHKNMFNHENSESVSVFNQILETCMDQLDNSDDLPMDTKSNCAMMVCMIVPFFEELSGDSVDKMINEDTCSLSKKLCLISGVVNSMNFLGINVKMLLKISENLKSIFLKTTVDPSSMLSIARSFMQIANKAASCIDSSLTQQLLEVLQPATVVAFLNLEHHMDAVRHLSRETIRYITEFYVNTHSTLQLEQIFDEIKALPINLQSIVILTIVPVVETSQMYHPKNFHNLNEKLLNSVSDNQVTNHNLINCYEALARKGMKDCKLEEWFQKFLEPTISMMNHYPPQSEERLIFENLVMRFVKKEPKVLDEILKKRGEYDIGFILLCLSTGKKSGRFEKEHSTEELWKGVLSFDEIRKAMFHSEDSIRSSAFMLIAEARKTTDGFTEQEFDCMMYFFRYNINVQSPSTRQNIIGMVKNIFVRIQAVLQALQRKKEMQAAEIYEKFLVKLHEFCLKNLFDGANFSRRTLSLKILLHALEMITEFFPSKSSPIWSQEKFNVIIMAIDDSFEDNKKKAVEIVKMIPSSVVREFFTIDLDQLKTLITSIKPTESLTASYLMELHAYFGISWTETDELNTKMYPAYLHLMVWCEKILLEGLTTAEKSLIVASSKNPLYGAILCIRQLVLKLDLKSLGSCQLWRKFFQRLLVLCKRLTLAVAPVVNNSSPEGILPRENIQGVDEATMREWMKIIDQTTPQIILLCSWRTIKEVSLLLGEVCLNAPIMSGDEGLLNVEQVLAIGDHFLELLSQTKHRGAFEQCFFGFSQYCLRLWVCNEAELHKLPSEMLQQMIVSISGQDKDNAELLTMKNLCATRRSAGLPFMVQALITSELKVSTNKNFHFVMKKLIDFCLHADLLETRTHSLNILRALFRCTDLNESISEYVADGIKVAILGYGSDSWIERNSSTLLFSALMVRVFGVQRTKNSDELHIRNKMTGRIFFLHYPGLYDFFMTQLYEAVEFINAEKLNAKLHPLLLLLIRLYPSALEGSESKLTLTGFIPVVTRCLGCIEMQTRILCAKFIANVTAPHLLHDRIMETIKVFNQTIESISSNTEHGVLLQILYLVKAMPPASAEQKDYARSMLGVIDELSAMRKRIRSKLVCFGTFVDVVTEVVEKLWELKSLFISELCAHLSSCLDYDKTLPFGLPIILNKTSQIPLMDFFVQDTFKLPQPFKSNVYESKVGTYPLYINSEMPPLERDSIINVLLLLLDFDYAMKVSDEYEIDEKEIFFIKKLPVERKKILVSLVKADMKVAGLITSILKRHTDHQFIIKAIDVLSYFKYENDGIFNESSTQEIIERATSMPEHFKKSLLKLANASLRDNHDVLLKVDFKFLVEISTDSSYFIK